MTEKPGFWISPLSSKSLTEGTIRYNWLRIADGEVYYIEGRPQSGKQVLVRVSADGSREDLSVESLHNARSAVHEYGGMPYAVFEKQVVFSNFPDHKLTLKTLDEEAKAITDGSVRFVDFEWTQSGLFAVAEKHEGTTVDNFIAKIDPATGEYEIIVEGHDFFSAPRVSPDGTKLAYIAWDHPNMPWDHTELWVAELGRDKAQTYQKLAGESESIAEPVWTSADTLAFISDKEEVWNPYEQNLSTGERKRLADASGEWTGPAWVLGESHFVRTPQGFAFIEQKEGRARLGTLSVGEEPEYFSRDGLFFGALAVEGNTLVFIEGYADKGEAMISLDLKTGSEKVIAGQKPAGLEPKMLSAPEFISFETSNNSVAHGIYYAPKNKNYVLGENKAPLIVKAHGGPSAASDGTFSKAVQYWTSRGFGFLDVNYRGSTGFGRAYRESLYGQWGVADIDDCEHGARHLIDKGLIDKDLVFIRGGSAGGYVVLQSMATRKFYKAGASYYGVGDVALLDEETHKFESEYMGKLVDGHEPKDEARWKARSPMAQRSKITTPVIFFQGLDDKVVPPNQSRLLYEALQSRGVQTELIEYEGEGHGFRVAKNIEDSIEKELAFYQNLMAP